MDLVLDPIDAGVPQAQKMFRANCARKLYKEHKRALTALQQAFGAQDVACLFALLFCTGTPKTLLFSG